MIGVAVIAAACEGAPPQHPAPKFAPEAMIALPGPQGAPTLPEPLGDPIDAPGVDVSQMKARERKAWWRWMSQLYAPCNDLAVSVAQCLAEERSCNACAPAAQFLRDRAVAGASDVEGRRAYGIRFGPDVKKVDLADSPSRGPENATITVVVWSDFECPACGIAVPYVRKALDQHSEVKLVHKLYPLAQHPHAHAAARAALAAKKQGKYWEMEALMFANQKHLEDSDLEQYATDIGLDLTKFRSDFADISANDIIERDRNEAVKHGLTGTPFILINGREFDLDYFRIGVDFEKWLAMEKTILTK